MSITQSENRAHQTTSNNSEMTRQSDFTAAKAAFTAGGTQAAYDAALKAADVAHLRRVIASGVANGGIQVGVFRQALFELTGAEV
jgi:hypothetical protein